MGRRSFLGVLFRRTLVAGPYSGGRTRHFRFNNLDDPEPIPRDTPYSSVIESDAPVVVQHTRLDSRQEANALLSTIAFSEA